MLIAWTSLLTNSYLVVAGLQDKFIAPVYFPVFLSVLSERWLPMDTNSGTRHFNLLRIQGSTWRFPTCALFMNHLCWILDHYHHNTKSKWMRVLHPCYFICAHTCSPSSSEHSLNTFCLTIVKNCWRQRSKKASGTCMFLVRGQLCDQIRLGKDSFSFNTAKNSFQWMLSLIFPEDILNYSLLWVSFLFLFFFLRET